MNQSRTNIKHSGNSYYPKNTMSDDTILAQYHLDKRKKVGHYVNDMKQRCQKLINDIKLCNNISDTNIFNSDMFCNSSLAGFTMSD